MTSLPRCDRPSRPRTACCSAFADALESERSFTYNSAHEIRTPIAAALAQAQLLAAMADETPLKKPAAELAGALSRLASTRGAVARPGARRRGRAIGRRVGRSGAGRAADRGGIRGQPVATRAAHRRGRLCCAGSRRSRCDRARGAQPRGERACAWRRRNRDPPGEHAHAATARCSPSIDDGPGAAHTEVASLSKRFTRGSGAGGSGAGLGLSIVDTLARRMGALLLLRSPVDGQRGFEARIVWQSSPV